MSVAYYIVLDRETGFDPFVNGKFIASNFAKFNSFCKKRGLKQIDEFVSQDIGEFLDEGDFPEQDACWYDAEEGVQWVNSLVEALENGALNFNAEEVIHDLHEYKSVFQKASTAGARWHFEIDF